MAEPRKPYLIGVDTGGTYTDAAVIEAEGHRVIASAKALTTRGDLSLGVTAAIEQALARLPDRVTPEAVSLVSVSTTLATNAVVEGHGADACVVFIGFDEPMIARSGVARAFPTMPIARIGGGHDHNGEERMPLDLAALDAALDARPDVEAFAVASAFAVRNPAHEHRARDAIAARTGRPVTVSSELSSALDAPRRALTAALNARLISRISSLIAAVQAAMKRLDLACPLMMVKGDGTLALADIVAGRPIETILSGPAASLVGARWLSGLDDFLMSDIGGTTTDVAILADGRPKVTGEGAEVGRWRTMVRAIDVRTTGLGGDSEVRFDPAGALVVGPQRILPVSLIGDRFPSSLDALESELAHPDISSLAGRFILRPFGWDGREGDRGDLSERERNILKQVGPEPKPLARVAVSAGAQRAVQALARKGLVQLAGFTPSDAAHVLDRQTNWSAAAARRAAMLMVRLRDMKAPTEEAARSFASDVWSEVVRLSAHAVLDAAFGGESGADVERAVLVDRVCSGSGRLGLASIAISLRVPVVAVGGPAQVYYGEVGRRLAAEVVFPPFWDVANAVGAATGVIARTVSVQVVADGGGIFRVHAGDGTHVYSEPDTALARAEAYARDTARAAVLQMGSGEPEVRITVSRHRLPEATDDRGLLSAEVVAEAVGRPDFAAGTGE
jgi:N-methylhydantoinase A/oxoprolinase/acetone carboxylase beta subunit